MSTPVNSRWRRFFGWSKSRAELFRECGKRYSFQYLFKWEKGRAAGYAKVLSKLASLAIRKGTLVHEEIERFVKLARDGEDLEASRGRLERGFDDLARRAGTQVLEARFGQWDRDEAAARVREAGVDALRQLDRFHADVWPRYRGLEVLSCEDLEKFDVGEHPMWVSADLVVRDPVGQVLLADWKTGKRTQDADDSVQLTGYILWATRKFDVPLADVRAELVWLATGEIDGTARTEADLEALRERIRVDSEEMLAVTSYDAIEAAPEERRCRRCPFLPLCREGSEFMDPAARARVLEELERDSGLP